MSGAAIAFGRRALGTALVAASFALVLAGCNRGKVEGEGRLDPHGRVILTRDDKPSTVTSARTLETGDKIEVNEGSPRIELPGGDVLELRPHSVLSLARGPDLRSGSLLVTTTGGTRAVRAAGNQVEAVGATRIDVSLAVRVEAYGGHAVIRSGGRTLDVPALREASVPVVGVLRGPQPLDVDPSDGWDQRFLGDAASKEAEAESRSRGFTAQVSTANAATASYYSGLLPGLAAEQFQQADVDLLGRAAIDGGERASAERIRAGDVLLGAAVALQGRRGTFAERVAGAAAFRGEGASWTLVALDQQVPSIGGLLGLVDRAVNVAPLELAPPGSSQPTVVASEPTPARAPTTTQPPSRTTPTTRPARTSPTTSPPTTALPQPQPQAPTARPPLLQPLDPVLDATVDPVAHLLNDLLGTNR